MTIIDEFSKTNSEKVPKQTNNQPGTLINAIQINNSSRFHIRDRSNIYTAATAHKVSQEKTDLEFMRKTSMKLDRGLIQQVKVP